MPWSGVIPLIALVLAAPRSGVAARLVPGCALDVPFCCLVDGDCDDADPCNGAERCGALGVCVAGDAAGDGSPCDDGDACTLGDACRGGACAGGVPVVCPAPGPCHLAGTCDPSSGACSAPPSPDGADCDDGDACTRRDACASGACVGGEPLACPASDACHAPGTCDPSTGTCSDPVVPDGGHCDDGDACTRTDSCRAGRCVGTDAVVCTARDVCHLAGTCNPATGACSDPPAPDSTPCDDDDRCTQVDHCQDGACIGTRPVVCTSTDQCHQGGTCSPATGLCSGPPRPDGSRCDDGDACTTSDVCRAGLCMPGPPRECLDDGVACTVERCTQGSCRAEPVDGRCIASGECTQGRCSPDDPGADRRGCVAVAADDGAACTDDGFSCTADVCVGGACEHRRNDVACAARSECGSAVCFPGVPTADGNGCAPGPPAPDGVACGEDDDPCTQDLCTAGVCLHQDVRERRTCDPIAGPYRLARALGDTARALRAALEAGMVAPSASADAGVMVEIDARLQAVASALDHIVAILSGREPAAAPGDLVAQQRALAATPIVAPLVPESRAIFRFVGTAGRGGEVSPDAMRDLRRQARVLRAGTRALKRDLRRVQRFTRVFARSAGTAP